MEREKIKRETKKEKDTMYSQGELRGKEKDKEKKSREERAKFCHLLQDSQEEPHGKDSKVREERVKCCHL